MRKALLLSAILLGLGGQAFADDVLFQSDDAPPLFLHRTSPTVEIRQGTKTIPIVSGQTVLEKEPHSMECGSTYGCIVTAKIWVGLYGNIAQPTVSAYVDDIAMSPTPTFPEALVLTAQQSARVSIGLHQLRSLVTQQSANGFITGWNVEYAIYELKR